MELRHAAADGRAGLEDDDWRLRVYVGACGRGGVEGREDERAREDSRRAAAAAVVGTKRWARMGRLERVRAVEGARVPFAPSWCSARAAVRPASPAPITTYSASSSIVASATGCASCFESHDKKTRRETSGRL